METQNAQDRNKAVQGFGNAGSGAIMYGDHSRRNPGPAPKNDDPSPNYDFGSGNSYGSSQEDPEVLKWERLKRAGQ
jgi:hypothetical protein